METIRDPVKILETYAREDTADEISTFLGTR